MSKQTEVKVRNGDETMDSLQSCMLSAMRQALKTGVEEAGSHPAGATAWALETDLPSQAGRCLLKSKR